MTWGACGFPGIRKGEKGTGFGTVVPQWQRPIVTFKKIGHSVAICSEAPGFQWATPVSRAKAN